MSQIVLSLLLLLLLFCHLSCQAAKSEGAPYIPRVCACAIPARLTTLFGGAMSLDPPYQKIEGSIAQQIESKH